MERGDRIQVLEDGQDYAGFTGTVLSAQRSVSGCDYLEVAVMFDTKHGLKYARSVPARRLRPADEAPQLAVVSIGGQGYDLFAVRRTNAEQRFFAAVYRTEESVPLYHGKTLHTTPRRALEEAFTALMETMPTKLR